MLDPKRSKFVAATALAASQHIARRLCRLLLACLLASTCAVVGVLNCARAYNIYADHFVNLSARPLGLGGAAAALSGPYSVFSNPAGLASIRRLTFLYNHSARHFPGSHEGGKLELDQLDADTEAIVVPVGLGTYAHGFAFSGELGYDYRHHPHDGNLGYPREELWGSHYIDAVATSAGLPCAAGIALRRELLRFTPATEETAAVPWLRLGEGTHWGLLARVWPGLDYGLSELRMSYDWTFLQTKASEREWPVLASKLVKKRQGWALHPAGWLTLAQDSVVESYSFGKQHTQEIGIPPLLGSVHIGNQSFQRQNLGAELQLGNLVRLDSGNYDGLPTCGLGVNLGGLWLNYAEIQDLLPRIIGSEGVAQDVHIYGFDWTW